MSALSTMKITLLLLCVSLAASSVNTKQEKKDIRKCCLLRQVYVEETPGVPECRAVSSVDHPDLNHLAWRDKKWSNYAMYHRQPDCAQDELLVPLYHVDLSQDSREKFELIDNGSLSVSINGREESEYSNDKYCIENLLVLHNFSHKVASNDVANFAWVCMKSEASVSEIVHTVVYPVGVAVSMSCLTLTFLLYSLLPQLRDLTGKFILGICTFLTGNYALRLIDVEMFGIKNDSMAELILEFIQHSCNVGTWLCLNSMGHQVWKVIRSKSVFTRVTDGQRCCYYSIYVIIATNIIAAIAITVHFLIGPEQFKVRSASLAVFYAPVVFLLIINVFFWWTSTKQIGKQLVYNRSMQHFQTNFDLFTKLFMVIGGCWFFQTLALLDIRALDYIGKIFTLIQGPMIFVVAMCRTRVIFLFKKYFCADACCLSCCRGNNDFIELPATELATIDSLRRREEQEDREEVTQSLLDKVTGSHPVSREISKSLFNVRSKPSGDDTECSVAAETPLMRVGNIIKASSLAMLNFGWRRETSV